MAAQPQPLQHPEQLSSAHWLALHRSGDALRTLQWRHRGTQAQGRQHGAVLVVGQRRGDFQAHVAGVAAALVKHRADHVAGALHVFDHQALVALLGAEVLAAHGVERGAVVLPFGDGLVEDRRVGGDAGHAGFDVAGKLAGLDEGAGQVVEPDLLAGGAGGLDRIHGVVGCCNRTD